jgi:hypothetical protein
VLFLILKYHAYTSVWRGFQQNLLLTKNPELGASPTVVEFYDIYEWMEGFIVSENQCAT